MNKFLVFFSLILTALVLMSTTIDLDFLYNYADQDIPDYIQQDNTDLNEIYDPAATLGRVLFYDKNLSTNNTIACASCHMQEFAFSDTSAVSVGVNGLTGRHSMRLVNARFAEEGRFFWDERAGTLEEQTTMPVRDHAEMGYSGLDGEPSFEDLINKLYTVDYYDDLFYFVYGDTEITEARIQESIAQFVRSIQSFDSRYDEGIAMVDTLTMPFPNFTDSENRGKELFMEMPEFDSNAQRIAGGAGCNSCHRAPEFDIDPVSRNNGVIQEIDGSINYQIHRSPTLRDIFHPITGELNGPLMHNAQFTDMVSVIEHYAHLGDNLSISEIAQLDTRFRVGANAQVLNLTSDDVTDMVNFLKTLSGTDMYVNEKWSDPFDINGGLTITSSPLTTFNVDVSNLIKVYPNPTVDNLWVSHSENITEVEITNESGTRITHSFPLVKQVQFDLSQYPSGVYFLKVRLADSENYVIKKLMKL